MRISSTLESKIRYMCQKFPTTEWSGVLFYSINDDINSSRFEITAQDFFLMDIGSSAYTDFKENPDMSRYYAENCMEYDNCYFGLIHSHHSMDTFFSIVDKDTLFEQGKDCNHFVSLIVNNKGTYNAAITTHMNRVANIDSVDEYYSYEDVLTHTRNKTTEKIEVVEYSYFGIYKSCSPAEEVPSEFIERIEQVIKDKQTAAAVNHKPAFTLFDDFGNGNLDKEDLDKIKPTIKSLNSKLDLILKQLLTCSIFVSSDERINIKLLDKKVMDRFPNMNKFEDWASVFIDWLIFSDLSDCDFDNAFDMYEDIAKYLINELKPYKNSKAVKVYIKLLSNLI